MSEWDTSATCARSGRDVKVLSCSQPHRSFGRKGTSDLSHSVYHYQSTLCTVCTRTHAAQLQITAASNQCLLPALHAMLPACIHCAVYAPERWFNTKYTISLSLQACVMVMLASPLKSLGRHTSKAIANCRCSPREFVSKLVLENTAL
jgi:hypothetical protein